MEACCVDGRIRIGTSGFSYEQWRGRFYPQKLASSERLKYYATQFDTVELNSPFYHLPKKELFERWARAVPEGFLFAVKASRYITHVKKLREIDEALAHMLDHYLVLERALGPILFQFPASFARETDRLTDVCGLLPAGTAAAFEFRHESWFCESTYAVLRAAGAALCIADSPRWPSALEVAAPFTLVRMHGGKVLYDSNYAEEELALWAERIRVFAADGLDCFVYFNNDAHGYAVDNARRLRSLLGLETAT